MNTLLEKKQLNSAVTPEQFCEDIDVLFHTLSLSYGMYEYWGKYAFEEDLKKNATYASIISLLVMILGRYFVKSVKWVNVNKTK